MCGRYATTRNSAELTALFEAIDETDGALAPDYNVAPTDPVPIVRVSERLGSRALSVARWGLVPPWATDPKIGARMINARAETVATSTAYAPSFARRRCLVPADGWYEWARRDPAVAGGRRGAARQPYFMTAADGSPLVFAGVWTTMALGRGAAADAPSQSHRSGGAGGQRLTCSIVTSAAIGELAAVHDRMPLLLPQERWSGWLCAPPDDPGLLAPTPDWLVGALEIRPVSPAVGDVRTDGPELIERVQPELPDRASDEATTLRLF